MAERKATNKYYPPDYDPRKGSINTFVGSHPLRDRARKLKTQGVLIIRFEMPYNVWCEGCNSHIGKGVRYNAEKKKIGMYLSTPIYQFRMRCVQCGNWMEIHTDPQHHDFKFVSGVRRKTETSETDAADRAAARVADDETAERLASDPMYRLEHGLSDTATARDEAPRLRELYEWRLDREDDYAGNAALRAAMRQRKAAEAAEEAMRQQPHKDAVAAFGAPVLPAAPEDEARVAAAHRQRTASVALAGHVSKRRLIVAAPVLPRRPHAPS